MTSGKSPRGGLGGLGALFFLGTLAAIALYVQRQSSPDDLELARTSATAIAEAEPEAAPPALQWQDRFDLAAAKLVPYGTTPTQVAAPGSADKPAASKGATTPDGRLVQDLGDGHRILLTIDPVLQDSMLQIFRSREVPYAAAVMLDLRDNSVLVLAGHSSMDPQVQPLEVVATAWAPAASVFKLITTVALIEAGVATPATQVCFNGGLHGITDDELRDDAGRDTQCESLAAAVAHSYNLVIGKLALKHIGQEQLARIAKTFLFESDIPFEFNVERSPAHIPSDPIERAKVAAGFWNIDMSPLHGALLASIFAKGGMYQPPHVIAQVLGPDGSDLTPAPPKSDRIVSREIAEALGAMMESTTTEGTARASFRDGAGNDYIQGVRVAGKTGSLTGRRAPSLNYNWFIGYAPADRPEVAFAVLLANEPKWRIKAHYAARRMVQLWIERRSAIAKSRDARLVADGLELPERDASGVLLSKAPAVKDAEASKGVSGKGASKGSSPRPAPDAPPTPLPALPPPPAAITAPAEEQLPPVPGAVPVRPAPGPMDGPMGGL